MVIANGDMPVTPIVMESGHPYHASQVCFENAPLVTGITKREAFAMAAMQGWLARCANVPHHATLEPEAMAGVAVAMADALLKELAK